MLLHRPRGASEPFAKRATPEPSLHQNQAPLAGILMNREEARQNYHGQLVRLHRNVRDVRDVAQKLDGGAERVCRADEIRLYVLDAEFARIEAPHLSATNGFERLQDGAVLECTEAKIAQPCVDEREPGSSALRDAGPNERFEHLFAAHLLTRAVDAVEDMSEHVDIRAFDDV